MCRLTSAGVGTVAIVAAISVVRLRLAVVAVADIPGAAHWAVGGNLIV